MGTEIDPMKLTLEKVPPNKIWPSYDQEFVQALWTPESNIFVKQPNLLGYDPISSHNDGYQILAEAKVCQVIMNHPHQNIVQYLGCLVDGDRVKGLCFVRYPMNLAEKVEKGHVFDHDHCLRGIQDGVNHLHMLGLVHNDLNPFNIMMDGDRPLITDFDSCVRVGEPLEWKEGTPEWSKKGTTHAEYDNDKYSVEKIRAYLASKPGH